MQQAKTDPTTGHAAARHRYDALDALRGICALMVCLFHFRASGPIASFPLVRGSWLFVDFFFVLSGFVIAASYRERLTAGDGMRSFAIRRFGRVYPLHLAMLLVFILIELLALAPAVRGMMHREPFNAEHSVWAIFTNLSLVHAFGLHYQLTWNHPSWTIAVEFWTYMLFGLAAKWAGATLEKWIAVAVAVSLVVLATLSPAYINASHSWSIFRCIYGFGVGALIWHWWHTTGQRPGHRYAGATVLEIAVTLIIIGFVSIVGATAFNLLAPLVFGLALIVFARAGGAISRGLTTPPLLLLGTLSYSIYLVHIFVQSRLDDALRLTAKYTGLQLLTPEIRANGVRLDTIGVTPLQGVFFTLLMLALVIGTSWLTWRWIEMPGQRWARRAATPVRGASNAVLEAESRP